MAPEMRTANALLMPKGEDFEFGFVLSAAVIDFLVIFSIVFFYSKGDRGSLPSIRSSST